ncbi:hypothetical protein DMI82_07350 [Blautia sp. BCRC 81119]|jgi:hypothetical protein|nr:hypothetical protein DMI82_07350 [Blautia sp. BCRC 81119]
MTYSRIEVLTGQCYNKRACQETGKTFPGTLLFTCTTSCGEILMSAVQIGEVGTAAFITECTYNGGNR